ncbi:Adenylate cyclase 1 [Crateriforma conspicua]|uniref:Adenylate cyclase 1 n=1 Tax=Crateriforma conspicua TaxID=2527996 RepID=A0A5C6FQW0_9PLAN|nr:Adenylate cyclase 1 [Crateriforma conspicua]
MNRIPDAVTPRPRSWSFAQRHALILVLLSPVLANLVGSLFNILYNQTQVQPLLTERQMDRFFEVVKWFNLVVYPIAIACFVVPVTRLRPIHRRLINGDPVDRDELSSAQRLIINLPWWFLIVAAIGWLICIPVFPLALVALGEPVFGEVITHLITSFLIASLIAVTQSFFAVELTIQKTLFPVFFQSDSPASVPGARPLSITHRGLLWSFTAVVCPVVSLLLIVLVPDAAHRAPLFAIAVAVVAIAFGFATSWMLGRLVVRPIRALKLASQRIADGHLNTHVPLQHADEFGLLIESFNSMASGLRERERLQQTFGRHVGQEAAKQILQQGDAGGGREQNVSIMFVDVRNFTMHSSQQPPHEIVAALNAFFAAAVERIEGHGGMVNKFLGDGLMAIFGVGTDAERHADQAVAAAIDLQSFVVDQADTFNDLHWPGFAIGIGINSGDAIVGSIGSPRRQEYTAMGDTVNVAARVESLTKTLSQPILITASTQTLLTQLFTLHPQVPQNVKGKAVPIELFAVEFSVSTASR